MTTTPTKQKEVELPSTVPLNTAQDAAMAYLRDEIDEDTFRAYCGRFGVMPEDIFPIPSRPMSLSPDIAYVKTLSNDIMPKPDEREQNLDEGGGNFRAGDSPLLVSGPAQPVVIVDPEKENKKNKDDKDEVGKIVDKTPEAIEVEQKQNNVSASGSESVKDAAK